MILAVGRIDAMAVLEAAAAMSVGRTAASDAPLLRHVSGWGALWRSGSTFDTHRSVRPIAESLSEAPLAGVAPDVLVVHARHATLPQNLGLAFTHPLVRESPDGDWYFFHNGYLPTVHERLGLAASRFDSAEYFDYVVPSGAELLDHPEVIAQLSALRPGGTSGNAFVVHQDAAHVIHWTPESTSAPTYYTMHRLETPDAVFISSDPVPELGPRDDWEPLPQRQVLEVPLPRSVLEPTIPTGR